MLHPFLFSLCDYDRGGGHKELPLPRLVLAALLALSLLARADNWPGWRNDGSGVSAEKNPPTRWNAATNVLWKVPVPGDGNSSPVIFDHRIFLTTSLDHGKKRVVLALDAADGHELFRREFPCERPFKSYPKNGFASHTCVADGKRVFTFFDEPGLVALEATDGKVAWQLPLGPFKQGGYLAASPVLAGDLLVMVCDVNESIINGEKHKGGFIVAVDKNTGAEKWRQPRKASWNAASPIAITVNGKMQIVASGDPVISYDAATGEELWSAAGMKPMCAPSPVFDGTLVWVASGRNGPAMSIDPTGRGDVTETYANLLTDTGGPYVPSPLVCPFLMLPGDDGQISLLDKSGDLLLRTKIPAHFSASPIAADGRIYWPDESGRTWVFDADKLAHKDARGALIATNDLPEPILASPAISGGRVYIRTTTSLYCIAGNAAVAAAPATVPATRRAFNEIVEVYRKHQAEEGADIPIRLGLVDDLAGIDSAESLDFLLTVAQKDNHWDVSEAAAKVLASRRATTHLLAMLDDKREFPKIIAADALGDMHATIAITKLQSTATDKNRFVRLAALRSLGKIAGSEDADFALILPTLLSGLDDPESPVKIAAMRALAAIAPSPMARELREKILPALQAKTSDKNLAVARTATQALNLYKSTSP